MGYTLTFSGREHRRVLLRVNPLQEDVSRVAGVLLGWQNLVTNRKKILPVWLHQLAWKAQSVSANTQQWGVQLLRVATPRCWPNTSCAPTPRGVVLNHVESTYMTLKPSHVPNNHHRLFTFQISTDPCSGGPCWNNGWSTMGHVTQSLWKSVTSNGQRISEVIDIPPFLKWQLMH